MKIPEIEVSVKYKEEVKASELFTIKSCTDAAEAFRTIFDADTMIWREEFMLLTLNRANHVTGYFEVSSGGTSGTLLDISLLDQLIITKDAYVSLADEGCI